jgi:hypothetical protein
LPTVKFLQASFGVPQSGTVSLVWFDWQFLHMPVPDLLVIVHHHLQP